MNIDFLSNVTIFKGLEKKELEKIVKICKHNTISENEFIFKENDTGNELFIIETGEVEILKSTVADQMKSLTILKRGEFLGEFSLLTDLKRSANAKAILKTTVWTINKTSFNEILEEDHSLGYKIMKNMVHEISIRLNNTNKKFKDHVFWGLTSIM